MPMTRSKARLRSNDDAKTTATKKKKNDLKLKVKIEPLVEVVEDLSQEGSVTRQRVSLLL